MERIYSAMNIKLVALDMDGTLLDSNKRQPPHQIC